MKGGRREGEERERAGEPGRSKERKKTEIHCILSPGDR